MAPALPKCQNLEKLDLCIKLTGTSLTYDSNTMGLLSSVLASLPRLSDLDLTGNHRIQDEGFLHVAPGLNSSAVNYAFCRRLRGCAGLTSDGRSMALLTLVCGLMVPVRPYE